MKKFEEIFFITYCANIEKIYVYRVVTHQCCNFFEYAFKIRENIEFIACSRLSIYPTRARTVIALEYRKNDAPSKFRPFFLVFFRFRFFDTRLSVSVALVSRTQISSSARTHPRLRPGTVCVYFVRTRTFIYACRYDRIYTPRGLTIECSMGLT